MRKVKELIDCLEQLDGSGSKTHVISAVAEKFGLVKDRTVFYCDEFAVRFSYSSSGSFSNTVLSLSKLQKFDEIPFLVCLVTSESNRVYLANTTFLSKISHSSQTLSMYNIKGSFNGSDILKVYDGIENNRNNIEALFAYHIEFGFEENLQRLVEATNDIVPTGSKFEVTENARKMILCSVQRAIDFNQSEEFGILKLRSIVR